MKKKMMIACLMMVAVFTVQAVAEEPITRVFKVDNFPLEESAIRGPVKEALKAIIEEIKIIQDENPDLELIIGVAGSASKTGTRAYNDRLSGDRAEATAGYMEDKLPGAIVNIWPEGDQHNFQGVRIECRFVIPAFSLKKEFQEIREILFKRSDKADIKKITDRLETLSKKPGFESHKKEYEEIKGLIRSSDTRGREYFWFLVYGAGILIFLAAATGFVVIRQRSIKRRTTQPFEIEDKWYVYVAPREKGTGLFVSPHKGSGGRNLKYETISKLRGSVAPALRKSSELMKQELKAGRLRKLEKQ